METNREKARREIRKKHLDQYFNGLGTKTELDKEWAAIRSKENDRRRREAIREAAIQKMGGNRPVCAVCGCPHIKALTFGHVNGSRLLKERRQAGNVIARWVMQNPIEEIQKHIRLECIYCNYYENIRGEYPPRSELPRWGDSNE